MKSKISRWIPVVLLLLLYIWIQQNMEILRQYDNKVSLIIENAKMDISGQDAVRMQKESRKGKGFSFTVWKQNDREIVSSSDTGRIHPTSVISVCGRTDLVVQSERVLDFDDVNQCLIGEETAYALFGGSDVKGLNVVYQQKEYKIAGILKDVKDAFLYQTNDAAEQGINRVSIQKKPGDSAKVAMEKFQNLYGVEASLVDYELTSFMLQSIVFLVPFLLAVLLLHSYKQEFLKSLSRPKYVAVYIAGACLLIFAVLFTAKGFIHIPEEIIPTIWSDAEFWRGLLAEKKENIKLILYMKKGITDIFYVNAYLKGVAGLVLSVFCIWHIHLYKDNLSYYSHKGKITNLCNKIPNIAKFNRK